MIFKWVWMAIAGILFFSFFCGGYNILYLIAGGIFGGTVVILEELEKHRKAD